MKRGLVKATRFEEPHFLILKKELIVGSELKAGKMTSNSNGAERPFLTSLVTLGVDAPIELFNREVFFSTPISTF